MIDGHSWRDVKAPDPLRERVLGGLGPPHSYDVKAAWAWRTLVVMGCASLVGLAVLLPQRSAAYSLDRLIAGQGRSDIMFRLLSYTISAKGKTPKIWSGYVKGNRWHYVQSDFEQAFDGVRTMTYHAGSGERYATIELGSEHGSGGILGTADLGMFKIVDRRNLTLDHETLWRGRKVDKYTMRFPYRNDNGGMSEGASTLYADPRLNVPLYVEDMYSPTSGVALEWQYLDPANEALLRINLPPGTEIRELKPQRNSAPLWPPEKAKNAGS